MIANVRKVLNDVASLGFIRLGYSGIRIYFPVKWGFFSAISHNTCEKRVSVIYTLPQPAQVVSWSLDFLPPFSLLQAPKRFSSYNLHFWKASHAPCIAKLTANCSLCFTISFSFSGEPEHVILALPVSRNGNPGISGWEQLPNKRLVELFQLFLFRIDRVCSRPWSSSYRAIWRAQINRGEKCQNKQWKSFSFSKWTHKLHKYRVLTRTWKVYTWYTSLWHGRNRWPSEKLNKKLYENYFCYTFSST